MFTTRENLITPILGSISVHQIFRNGRCFYDLRVQTFDLISLATLLVKISVLLNCFKKRAMLDVIGHPTDQEICTCTP